MIVEIYIEIFRMQWCVVIIVIGAIILSVLEWAVHQQELGYAINSAVKHNQQNDLYEGLLNNGLIYDFTLFLPCFVWIIKP